MWADIYKIFAYAFQPDPLAQKKDIRGLTGAGVSQPDAIPDVRQDGSYWGGGQGLIRLRDTNDFIDLSTVTNRQSRYKEYERLRNVAEIEMAMTVFADEACLDADTCVSTVFEGPKSMYWLEKNKKDTPFLVYSWDFIKNDYTLAWAYNPRIVKIAPTVRIILDDGSFFICTLDHRILMRTAEWKQAGALQMGDELMPFYRVPANHALTDIPTNQFPRIFTFENGWVHERQFIDEWRKGKKEPKYERVNRACRLLASGMSAIQTAKMMGNQWPSISNWIRKEGFSTKEMRALGKKEDRRRVVGVVPAGDKRVYDLSVKDHENFCGESAIFHNCQKGENNHVFEIICKNEEAREELEFLFFNRKMLNMDRRIWNRTKNTFIMGDEFWELVVDPENPKDGILKIQELPAESVYRIETTKGKLVEFQQSKEGPDYEALTRAPVTEANEAEIQQSKAIRFSPDQVIHIRIGDDRKTFYPYGQSLIEPARGPAHQLRLMEDAMVVYRLTRAPERRVFYIDVGQLPPFKAEAFIERMKDQFRKKKVASTRSGGLSPSAVEERWKAPAADEDYWLPIRPNSNTRIDTLPGAQNLGEIDDAVYFRNKLFTALNFPKNYFATEDVQQTRISLSAQDVKFARMIERLQGHMEDGLRQVAERHLQLRGYPEETYSDLNIKMTPPSDWRELSRAEVITNRINNANGLKGSMLMSDFDILTRWMKFSEDEAKAMLSRMTIQKLQDLKLQILAQNPQLLGIGVPGAGEQEMGAEAGGPSPMLAPGGQLPPEGGMPGGQMPVGQTSPENELPGQPAEGGAAPLPEPSAEELKRFDLQIQTYSVEMDREEPDYSQL